MKNSLTRLLTLPLLSAIALMSACSNPISYDSDFQINTDFANFKTYSWHAPNEHNDSSNIYIDNDLIDGRIREAIDTQLQAKGFTRLNSGDVDFMVNYTVTSEDRLDISTYNTYSGYGAGWGGGYYGTMGGGYRYGGYGYSRYGYGGYGGPTGTETKVSEYQQGTFVLDILDDDEDKLVWRGTAEGKMSKVQLTPQERDSRVIEIVGEVLAGFPPKL